MPTSFDLSFQQGSIIQPSQVNQFGQAINRLEKGQAYYAAATLTGSVYSATLTPAPLADAALVYAPGTRAHLKIDVANPGAVSLNLNNMGAKPIKSLVGLDLQAGDFRAGQVVALVYDGSQFQFLNNSHRHKMTDIVGVVPVSYGGTGRSSFSKGDLLVGGSGANLNVQAIGSNNQVLLSDLAQPNRMKWATLASFADITQAFATLATAQTFNLANWTDASGLSGAISKSSSGPLLIHLCFQVEMLSGSPGASGSARMRLSGSPGTYYAPPTAGSPVTFLSPSNLNEPTTITHTFLLSAPAGNYTLQLEIRGDFRTTTSNYATCSAFQLP